ncbi:thioesterase [Streptomyces sp. MUM 203J]|uniref:thioesterase II family protein n=1 Tax=Streptomyces sp. MUM 203J TaxID=2791990 RepID=UPI001F03CE5E|nr:alpha/beta fold hydrolase [Streptomyces sp. MUM 203J]MCH0541716.1 thioesterase [Streptomyces sp. MUM 203J]
MSESHAGGGAWIRRFHPSPDAGVRLVCFPHAGGSAGFFHRLSRDLAPGAEVLAVQYPGRQDRRGEPNIPDLAGLADRAAEALRPALSGTAPFALFGHSMGATLAYEVARRLRSDGRGAAALFVSARTAPHRSVDHGRHELSDRELVEDVLALGGTAAGVLDDPELLEMVLPSIRSDYRAVGSYRHAPGPLLDCAVHAFTGVSDPRVPVAELRHWAECTEGPFGLEVFSGGHFYLVERHEEFTRSLAGCLKQLASASG